MKECHDKGSCMGRREFLVKAGLVAGATVLTVSSLRSIASASPFEDVTIAIGADSPLTKVGGSQIVDSSAGKLIVIRSGESKYAAFSAICTHKRGLMSFDSEKNQLVCPKHGSKFDAKDGSVQAGPADTPVASYPVKTAKDSVIVVVGS